MPKYKVNLSASFELDTIDEMEARYHAIRLLEKDIWGNIKVDSVQKLTSKAMQKYAGDRGKHIKGRDMTEDENTAICLENISEW